MSFSEPTSNADSAGVICLICQKACSWSCPINITLSPYRDEPQWTPPHSSESLTNSLWRHFPDIPSLRARMQEALKYLGPRGQQTSSGAPIGVESPMQTSSSNGGGSSQAHRPSSARTPKPKAHRSKQNKPVKPRLAACAECRKSKIACAHKTNPQTGSPSSRNNSLHSEGSYNSRPLSTPRKIQSAATQWESPSSVEGIFLAPTYYASADALLRTAPVVPSNTTHLESQNLNWQSQQHVTPRPMQATNSISGNHAMSSPVASDFGTNYIAQPGYITSPQHSSPALSGYINSPQLSYNVPNNYNQQFATQDYQLQTNNQMTNAGMGNGSQDNSNLDYQGDNLYWGDGFENPGSFGSARDLQAPETGAASVKEAKEYERLSVRKAMKHRAAIFCAGVFKRLFGLHVDVTKLPLQVLTR